jgi:hypothetical protein
MSRGLRRGGCGGGLGRCTGATKLPFVGFTIASDGAWSARFWERTAPRQFAKRACAAVRVVGERLRSTFMEALAPVPRRTDAQIRTISACGKRKQADLARLRVGIVGAGSVGAFIAEGMARTGLEDITGRASDHRRLSWDEAPRYVSRDRDQSYGAVVTRRLRTMGIRDKPITPASPWQNGFAERLIGSIRRECLDHLIVFGEKHLRRILKSYADYYNCVRTHRSLHKDAPVSRPVQRSGMIVRTLPWADFIINTFGFRFSVQTGLSRHNPAYGWRIGLA